MFRALLPSVYRSLLAGPALISNTAACCTCGSQAASSSTQQVWSAAAAAAAAAPFSTASSATLAAASSSGSSSSSRAADTASTSASSSSSSNARWFGRNSWGRQRLPSTPHINAPLAAPWVPTSQLTKRKTYQKRARFLIQVRGLIWCCEGEGRRVLTRLLGVGVCPAAPAFVAAALAAAAAAEHASTSCAGGVQLLQQSLSATTQQRSAVCIMNLKSWLHLCPSMQPNKATRSHPRDQTHSTPPTTGPRGGAAGAVSSGQEAPTLQCWRHSGGHHGEEWECGVLECACVWQ